MSNEFYNPSGFPFPNEPGDSASARGEFTSIGTGFNKMPAIGGHALQIVRVNAPATALESVDPGSMIDAATAKTTLVDADEMPLADSATSFTQKKITWANLRAALFAKIGAMLAAAASKATPVGADSFLIQDSASANATTQLTLTNLVAYLAALTSTWAISISGAATSLLGIGNAAAFDARYGSAFYQIAASVATNALTATLNSPAKLEFRNTTLGTGTSVDISLGANISLVVPSGATLGTINAQLGRLMLLAINNAGTVELAIVNQSGGVNLDETTLISTTAISAAATANNVIYSTTARTNVAFRVVGYIEATEATAGTWATAPSLVQSAGGQAAIGQQTLGNGQTWQNVTGSRAFGTTYYNTTGRPIQLHIAASSSAATSTFTITVNGVNIQAQGGTTGDGFCYASLIIPPGAAYGASLTAAASILQWSELR